MSAELEIHYDAETDTLSVWNGRPVYSSYEAQQYLLIELDSDRTPVGFTLEHAIEMLRPHLSGHSESGQTTSKTGPASDSRPGSAAGEFNHPASLAAAPAAEPKGKMPN